MPPPSHLLIAYAATAAPSCQHTLQRLELPHLNQLLARLGPAQADPGDELDYTPPHERALARALHLPADFPPWAAWESRTAGAACAWMTPCHWQAGADQIHMHPPQTLALTEAESRALLALLAPWFADEGITLAYHAPLRWLATGEPLDGLHTASLDRVEGRDISHWRAHGPQERLLQRLHSEVQMLLYTHAFNDAREAAGQLPVNAFWLHGAGRLAQPVAAPEPAPVLALELRAAALGGDWPAWADAWRQLDAGAVAALLAQVRAGQPVQLTLCGERSARSFDNRGRGLLAALRRRLQPQRFATLQAML